MAFESRRNCVIVGDTSLTNLATPTPDTFHCERSPTWSFAIAVETFERSGSRSMIDGYGQENVSVPGPRGLLGSERKPQRNSERLYRLIGNLERASV